LCSENAARLKKAILLHKTEISQGILTENRFRQIEHDNVPNIRKYRKTNPRRYEREQSSGGWHVISVVHETVTTLARWHMLLMLTLQMPLLDAQLTLGL
jgi:exopolyphosphatase/pppGpp-phosphohydrolase